VQSAGGGETLEFARCGQGRVIVDMPEGRNAGQQCKSHVAPVSTPPAAYFAAGLG